MAKNSSSMTSIQSYNESSSWGPSSSRSDVDENPADWDRYGLGMDSRGVKRDHLKMSCLPSTQVRGAGVSHPCRGAMVNHPCRGDGVNYPYESLHSRNCECGSEVIKELIAGGLDQAEAGKLTGNQFRSESFFSQGFYRPPHYYRPPLSPRGLQAPRVPITYQAPPRPIAPPKLRSQVKPLAPQSSWSAEVPGVSSRRGTPFQWPATSVRGDTASVGGGPPSDQNINNCGHKVSFSSDQLQQYGVHGEMLSRDGIERDTSGIVSHDARGTRHSSEKIKLENSEIKSPRLIHFKSGQEYDGGDITSSQFNNQLCLDQEERNESRASRCIDRCEGEGHATTGSNKIVMKPFKESHVTQGQMTTKPFNEGHITKVSGQMIMKPFTEDHVTTGRREMINMKPSKEAHIITKSSGQKTTKRPFNECNHPFKEGHSSVESGQMTMKTLPEGKKLFQKGPISTGSGKMIMKPLRLSPCHVHNSIPDQTNRMSSERPSQPYQFRGDDRPHFAQVLNELYSQTERTSSTNSSESNQNENFSKAPDVSGLSIRSSLSIPISFSSIAGLLLLLFTFWKIKPWTLIRRLFERKRDKISIQIKGSWFK